MKRKAAISLAGMAMLALLLAVTASGDARPDTFDSPVNPRGLHGFHAFLDRSGGLASGDGMPAALAVRWVTDGDWTGGHWQVNFDWFGEGWTVGPSGKSGDGVYNWMVVSDPVSGTLEAGQTRLRIRYYEDGAGPVLDTFWLRWPEGPVNAFWPVQIYENELVIDGLPTFKIQACAWLTATYGTVQGLWRNNDLPQEGYVYTFRGGGGSQESWDEQVEFCGFTVDGPAGGDCEGHAQYGVDPFGLGVVCFLYKPRYHQVVFHGAGHSIDQCDPALTFPCYVELWEHDGTDAHPWRVAVAVRWAPGCGDCAARGLLPVVFKAE